MNSHTATTEQRRLSNNHLGYRIISYFLGWEPTPGIIAVIYLVLAFAGLYLSDVWLVRHIADQGLLQQLQALKGGAEIVLSAGLIFILTLRSRHHLQAKNRRLRRAQDELTVLHRVLRHNLRNDINVIDGYTEMVREEPSESKVATYCDHIRSKIEDIIDYVEKTSKISKITSDVDETVTLEITDLTGSLSIEDDGEAAVSTTLDVPDSTQVQAHPSISDAIAELVENAIIHNDTAQPEVTVTVIPLPEDGGIAIEVADNGPGMPEKERQTFDRHRENHLTHSLGIGLWFVYWAVSVSGGTFEIAENHHGGCLVTVRLPTV